MTEEKKENKGHIHERQVVETLKEAKLASPGYKTGKNSIDAVVLNFKMELKEKLHAQWIQKSMIWVDPIKKWQFVLPFKKQPQVDFMEILRQKPEILAYINECWPEPIRRSTRTHGRDVRNFLVDSERCYSLKTIEKEINISNEYMMDMIRAFYHDKKVSYIHAGNGFGLYHLHEDYGHLGTPKFEGGTVSMSARTKPDDKKNKKGEVGYVFQLQMEVKTLPKSSIDLTDPIMLQSFVEKHRDRDRWTNDNWERLNSLVHKGFLDDLPPKRPPEYFLRQHA